MENSLAAFDNEKFYKEYLTEIQDKMRVEFIKSFNRVYNNATANERKI